MFERIEINPKKLAGKAVIKGTRIPVYLILELLESGYDFKKIIEAYPKLTAEDIKAAIEYSVRLLKNEEVVEYGVTWIPKFLLDENISRPTKKYLEHLGYDVKDVYDYNLGGSEDEEIIKKAIEENRVIVTLDADFSNIYYFAEKREFGVIVVRIHPLTVENVNAVIANFLECKIVKEIDITKSLIILGKKIRIRRKKE